MQGKLKLFVWTEFWPDGTNGMAFAIAETEEEARMLIIEECDGIEPPDWGTLEVCSLDDKVAREVIGGV